MDKVRIGIVGFGGMGQSHASYFKDLKHATLSAVCDIDAGKRTTATERYGVPVFATHNELLASGACDAILVAVPHYDHIPVALDGFKAGVHVMIEKPAAVSVKAARQAAEAYKNYPNLKFGIMLNQRTNPMFLKMRQLIADGELGEITRLSWIITNWFRTWTYYSSGGWRGTWKGEGGGVLINQCPHNLDLIQWVANGLMPNRITAVGFVGKTHPIEVEDEMSAILEYPNGAIGHFITTTGEAPGTNRLEICGDRGKLVAEHGRLKFSRTRESVSDTNKNSPQAFAHIETWDIDIPLGPAPSMEHKAVTERFIDVIRNDRPNTDLVAEGSDGVNGLEIGNAMMKAGLTRQPVELPLDGDEYDAFIDEMAAKYGGRKSLETKKLEPVDMATSFAR